MNGKVGMRMGELFCWMDGRDVIVRADMWALLQLGSCIASKPSKAIGQWTNAVWLESMIYVSLTSGMSWGRGEHHEKE